MRVFIVGKNVIADIKKTHFGLHIHRSKQHSYIFEVGKNILGKHREIDGEGMETGW